ncbi:hypothetical protein [Leekyejoonella antrihumi]|uniref:DUF559 domain-containing protein n=1 Tax=Leekyejoonella antrihumi TaxID=1660198 RepID=A0A563E766_9MICO|nr:hypothetical protein [Leekyejoonella antrihumi]TWP38149.1 hypothetical protein FGL98_02670 [Leekyejoonella antrihumi]
MPRSPDPLPDHLRRIPFTVAKARADGVAAGRLEASDLARPTSGVRALAVPRTTLDRARAFALVLPNGAVFSHQSAAEILGLPLPRRLETNNLHICIPGDGPVVRRNGAVGHRRAEHKRRLTVRGLCVAAPEDVLVDLAPVLSVEELVQIGDAILVRAPECAERVASAVTRRRGARGMSRLRQAMELMRVGSAMETVCRLRMRERGLPAPLLNHDIVDQHGQWIACVHFCWPDQRVVLEYDGEVHGDPRQRRKNAGRRRQLSSCAWTVIVVTDQDVLGSGDWLDDLHGLPG